MRELTFESHGRSRRLRRPATTAGRPGVRGNDGFPAELASTLVADWKDAPDVNGARTTKLVLSRRALDLGG